MQNKRHTLKKKHKKHTAYVKPLEEAYQKYKTSLCDNDMTFEECELAILRHAVDETEEIKGKKIANSEEVKKLLDIVETFIREKKMVCYGGTAINNILPKYAQFYNHDIEIPDYDFYSSDALSDAKELADIYHKAGYAEVEAKAGVHMGTFKVFVNFIPIADITQMHPLLFKEIKKEAILIAGIHYAPADFLRMAMYLELSRPAGDVSRWEKVMKRLTLLNEHYPLTLEKDCDTVDFQRKMESETEDSERLYITIRDAFIDQSVIFFGGYATSLYSRYMPEHERRLIEKIPDFDVLSEDPDNCSVIIKEHLERAGFKKVKIIKHESIGETIPPHVEIKVGQETLAFIYKPIACHSYNMIRIDNKEINIATIDTILSFYLSFVYADIGYSKSRLLCMAKFLFDVEQKNRLEQRGLLKRFSIECYGKQETLEEMRAEKAKKFKELMGDKKSKEYQMWFLKYNPGAGEPTVPSNSTSSNKVKVAERPSTPAPPSLKKGENKEEVEGYKKPKIQKKTTKQRKIPKSKGFLF